MWSVVAAATTSSHFAGQLDGLDIALQLVFPDLFSRRPWGLSSRRLAESTRMTARPVSYWHPRVLYPTHMSNTHVYTCMSICMSNTHAYPRDVYACTTTASLQLPASSAMVYPRVLGIAETSLMSPLLPPQLPPATGIRRRPLFVNGPWGRASADRRSKS